MCCGVVLNFFFFKQKTAYEMRISDWSSDVCSSDLVALAVSQLKLNIKVSPQTPSGQTSTGVPFQAHKPGALVDMDAADDRSEERRVGKECVSTCRSRWSPYH